MQKCAAHSRAFGFYLRLAAAATAAAGALIVVITATAAIRAIARKKKSRDDDYPDKAFVIKKIANAVHSFPPDKN